MSLNLDPRSTAGRYALTVCLRLALWPAGGPKYGIWAVDPAWS
jgi:hypothetical protein